jgi:hypothetical protein
MISKTYFRDILITVGLSIALTIFITRPGFSQDTTKMKGDKKVTIVAKIVEDKNGKKQEFDTTINLNRKLKPGEEEGMMKEFKMRMKELEDRMKDLESELNEMKLPDSGMMDSAQRHIERVFRDWEEPGNFHFRHNFNPREFNFNYDFDFPEHGEFPQRLLREYKYENGHGIFNDEHQGRVNGKDESLNDLLGEIPIDQVKSYSIKDTKDGKRIVIELNKEPLIVHHRDVIILRSPGPERMYRKDYKPQMKKKEIINNGDKDKGEKEEEENEN